MSNGNSHLATAGPCGLMVLAFYLGCLWPGAVGMAEPSVHVLLIPLGLAGAVVQSVAGIVELARGNILGGNVNLAFSAFMWYGAGGNLLKFLHIGPTNTSGADGWVFLVMGLFMLGFTPIFCRATLSLSVFILATDVFFISWALSWILGNAVLFQIGAWALPVVIIAIVWDVVGTILNSVLEKQVISLGSPLIKPEGSEKSKAQTHLN